MDFGYSADPTAIIDCALHENDLYLDELCYRARMLASDIITELKKQKERRVISESADPRLIQEIANAGINIYPVDKYQGSVMAGIMKMLEMNIKVTKRSFNLLNEFRNYTYDKDKDGNFINQPIDAYNHGCFAGSTLIETKNGLVRIDELQTNDLVCTSYGYRKVKNIFNNGCKKRLYTRISFCNFAISFCTSS